MIIDTTFETVKHGILKLSQYTYTKKLAPYSNTPLRIMVIDTETASLAGDVYDIGYTIANKKGEIFVTRNWLVQQVFTNGKVMKGAFFASKMFSEYADMLHNGTIRLTYWLEIVAIMRQDFETFKVNVLAAYNLPFDLKVILQTHGQFGDGKRILPPCKKLDLYRFTCMAKLNSIAYKKLAEDRNWKTKAGNYLTNAEVAYKYCTGDYTFKEKHTALDDCIIETLIMRYCFSAKGVIPYDDLRTQQWRIVNP